MTSCEMEQEDISPQTTETDLTFKEYKATELLPVHIDSLTSNSAIENNSNNRTAAEGTPTWKSGTGEGSVFYRDGNVVYEELDGKITFTFSIWLDDGGNFLYINDKSRINLALPLWNPGKTALSYRWDTNQRKWVVWRAFQYKILFGNACDYDNEPPTIGIHPCPSLNAYSLDCRLIAVTTNKFPIEMIDHTLYMEEMYQITDNCDDDLTIRQTPAPGTIIEEPQAILVNFDVIDNNGNTRSFRQPAIYKTGN